MTSVARLGPEARSSQTYARSTVEWSARPALLQPVPRGAQAVEMLEALLGPRELEALAARVSSTMQPVPPGLPADPELVTALSRQRAFSPEERLTLEIDAALRSFEQRRRLLDGALTPSHVARLLGRSRQTIHDRVRNGTLLAVNDGGVLRFPPWQFDPHGPKGVIAGLPEVLAALAVPPLSKISWLTRPNPYFEGRTPLEVLKSGDITRVVSEAAAVEVS